MEGLFIFVYYSIQLPPHLLRGSSPLPSTELAPVCLVIAHSATPPADNTIEQCTCNESEIKHAQHVTADFEGPEPSQEEEAALPLPVHCLHVGRRLQFFHPVPHRYL